MQYISQAFCISCYTYISTYCTRPVIHKHYMYLNTGSVSLSITYICHLKTIMYNNIIAACMYSMLKLEVENVLEPSR